MARSAACRTIPLPIAGRRTIPDPGFAGDDGAAHPGLAAALAAYASDRGRHLEVFLALQGARLLVPVLAVPGDVEVEVERGTREQTSAPEKTSDMATVLVTGRDGRRAMLGFTSVETLAAWRADARPVPVAASSGGPVGAGGRARRRWWSTSPGPRRTSSRATCSRAWPGGWMLADTGQGLAFVEEVDDDEVSE